MLRSIAGRGYGTQPHDKARSTAHGAGLEASTEIGADILRAALVLPADHELNASAFAVRVVASTGASLAACLVGRPLRSLNGPLHGGTTSLVEILFDEPTTPATRRCRRGALAARRLLPGFEHPLYPDGDPVRPPCWRSCPSDRTRDALAPP